MERDSISEVGIDDQGRLYVSPKSIEFPLIYREAMEVHWDASGKFLYSPAPRQWTYTQWLHQIIRAAREQSCELYLDGNTKWINVLPSDMAAMNSSFSTPAN